MIGWAVRGLLAAGSIIAGWFHARDVPTFEFGLGETTKSFFLSPSKPTAGGLIWGVGPAFLWPTATDDSLGTEKWGVGPTGVVLTHQGRGPSGARQPRLVLCRPPGRFNVSSTFVQPFASYNFGQGWSVTLNTESSADWTNNKLTVPVNLVVAKVFEIGDQAMSLGVGGRY
ncbi:hypothetical protein KBI52_05000 [Microvirga sp. HBU67558]|uniref:hypothetical protein n=1 Tax=Microvirga TaxID=186650 RepID=UPI001B36E62C|nr:MULTISPECIES: hypothetical protein [unclassified Microvirga]MBQ0819577.1 hypothetical protein [Microvirga sp. HBU67558]